MTCPNCGSDRFRRGGSNVWAVYIFLIVFAVAAVMIFHLNAAIVAGVVLAGAVLANLVFDTRVCLDCGTQWKGGSSGSARSSGSSDSSGDSDA